MAQVQIQFDRGRGWEVRQTGELNVTAATLAEQLPAYCTGRWPHRALLDGVVVAAVDKHGKAVSV